MESDTESSSTLLENSNPEELFEQLRNWQQQQQQRLLEQQQQQRKMLIEQQNKLLTMINPSDNQSIPTSALSVENSNPTFLDVASVSVPQVNVTPGQIQNVQNRNFVASRKQSFDEIPLKKPRAVKSFNQLLETSLTKNENAEETADRKSTKKFPFLKRGQGISRFGFDPKLPEKKKVKSGLQKKVPKEGKENKAPILSKTKEQGNDKKQKTTETLARNTNIMLPAVHTPSENHVNMDEKEDQANSNTQVSMAYCQQAEIEEIGGDSYIIQDEPKTNRDEEDLAVFELLERFATINASFSSTSSFIGQLLDKGINQLPSPSKVISFLAKKKQIHIASHDNLEGQSDERAPRPLKGNKHVRFAESLEVSDASFLEDKPWLSAMKSDATSNDRRPESPIDSHPSPFISNTCQPLRTITNENSAPERSNQRVDLNETPTSPIGFPDFKKLFVDPTSKQPFWLDRERHLASKGSKTESSESKDDQYDIDARGTVLSSALPIEDPQAVYQNSLMRSRLLSLEREISHYRRENDALRRARKEHEESKLKLEQEQEKFRRYVENEKRRMQLLYSEEQKRVRTEQLKDSSNSKGSEEDISKLREEIKQVKEDYRIKESKWMANQTKVQDKVRFLELRNRELTEGMEKMRSEEQQLRRRLNASLRPGAMMKNPKTTSSAPERNADTGPEEKKRSQPSPLIPSTSNIPSPKESPAQPDSCAKDLGSSEPEEIFTNQHTPNPMHESTGVTTTLLPDGTKLLLYPNGNRKEIWPDGKGTQVIYYNGDVKQKLADGSVVYIYADSGTKHTTKPDGTDILEFTSGQIETTFPDGRSQVRYPGGATKTKYLDGREEAQWPDGTKLWTDGKGHGVMTFPSGMREIYTPICKRREYPDGTVKTVYEDGRSETRYSNGRIRVKDRDGNIVTDTGEIKNVK